MFRITNAEKMMGHKVAQCLTNEFFHICRKNLILVFLETKI